MSKKSYIDFGDNFNIGELVFLASLIVGELVCRRVGLSASSTVGELVCRRIGLSASWFVGKLSSYPIKLSVRPAAMHSCI